jgi:hypothetical protein
MNWNAVGAIGQILGSLAVFVTIGFLAVQVHDNKTQMQRSIAESRTERGTQANTTLATNERLVGIHVKFNQALRGDKPLPPFIEAVTRQFGLTQEEAVMLYTDLLIRWQVTAQTIPYADDLPPGDRAQFDRGLRTGTAEPAFLFWYNLQKPMLNPDAVRYVDNLLAQPG